MTGSELTRLFVQKVLEKAVDLEGETNPLTAVLGKILKRLPMGDKKEVISPSSKEEQPHGALRGKG